MEFIGNILFAYETNIVGYIVRDNLLKIQLVINRIDLNMPRQPKISRTDKRLIHYD